MRVLAKTLALSSPPHEPQAAALLPSEQNRALRAVQVQVPPCAPIVVLPQSPISVLDEKLSERRGTRRALSRDRPRLAHLHKGPFGIVAQVQLVDLNQVPHRPAQVQNLTPRNAPAKPLFRHWPRPSTEVELTERLRPAESCLCSSRGRLHSHHHPSSTQCHSWKHHGQQGLSHWPPV